MYTQQTPAITTAHKEQFAKPLLTLMRLSELHFIKCGDLWHETDRLFITWCGEPMHPNTPYTWLERFCESNNFPFKGLHAFRHTFAAQAITNGTDVATVSSVLGHSQTSTTLNLYTHAVQAANVKAINVTADLLSDKVTK